MTSPFLRRFAVFLILLLALVGCSQLPQNNDPKAMREWNARYGDNADSSQILNTMPRDDLDRVVELKSVPKRVLVLGPGATEMVYALGLQSKIVGRDSASDFPIAAQKLPIIGDFNGPNIERALAQNPDFVIVQGETYDRDRIDSWQKQIGAPVASIAAKTVKGVAQDVEKIGAWLGKKPTKPLSSLAPISQKPLSGKAPTTALFEIDRQPLMVAGSDTLSGDVLRQSGLTAAPRGISGYKQINLESLLAKQPDFYVVASNNLKTENDVKTKLASQRNRVLDELRQTAGLKGLKCIQQGRVLVLPADWVLRPGPRLGLGIAEMTRQRLYIEAKN